MNKMPSPHFCLVVLFLGGLCAQTAASSTHLHNRFLDSSDSDDPDQLLQNALERNDRSQKATMSNGPMEMLILRIIDKHGNEPKNDANKLSDMFFGTHGNTLHGSIYDTSEWFESCSGGKLKFQPAVGPSVIDGVLEMTIEVVEDADSPWGNRCEDTVFHQYIKHFEESNKNLGIKYESIGYIPPHSVCNPGGGGLGGGKNHIYFTGTEIYHELVVHEIGHCLGLHHSSTVKSDGSIDEYGDHSCMMGCCAGAQQMCFNAPKSWELGWYSEEGKEGFHDLRAFDKYGLFWKSALVGIDDYLNDLFDETQHKVIVRLADLFISFNRAKGVTHGTKAYPDKVVIYEQKGRGQKSRVKEVLDDHDESSTLILPNFTLQNYDLVIKVCDIKLRDQKMILLHKPIVDDDDDDGTGDTDNIALGKPTKQSSTLSSTLGLSKNAVDGNTDGNWGQNSVTHTLLDTKAWWEVDLLEKFLINKVKVWNRQDCCADRLDDFDLIIMNGGNVAWEYKHQGRARRNTVITVEGNVMGDKVKVQLRGRNHLQLAEVQVYGKSERRPGSLLREDDVTTGNIGNKSVVVGTASQSHSWSDWDDQNLFGAAYNAVDGNKRSFSHTTGDTSEQWWKWTFDKPTVVQKIIVTNHGNKDKRLNNAVVELFDEHKKLLASQNLGIDINTVTVDFDAPYTVKVVKIQTPGSHLVVNEVEIWGAKPVEPLPDHANVITYISDSGNRNLFSCDTAPSVVPDGLKLVRNSEDCVQEDATNTRPTRFRCSINPTFEVTKPSSYGNAGLMLYTRKHKAWGCGIVLQPVHWSLGGNNLYFESRESLSDINDCLRPGSVLKETISWSTKTIIPDNVELLRSNGACVFQKANPNWGTPDRFYCPIEKTQSNNAPHGYDKPSMSVYGDDCGVELRPVHWSHQGKQFYFTSSEDLMSVNECFAPGVLLTEFPPTGGGGSTPAPTLLPTGIPSNLPTSNNKVCDGLSKKKCKKLNDVCVYGKSKIKGPCAPKKSKYEHKCSQYDNAELCLKLDHSGLCKFEGGVCLHVCDGLEGQKCKKLKISFHNKEVKACRAPKIKNPCMRCKPKTCS